MGLAATGCGGGSSNSKSTSTAASTPGIGARVLKPSELPGFQSQGVQTAAGAKAFTATLGLPPGEVAKQQAHLAKAGFVTGAVEHLTSSAAAEGLSVTDRFASSKSATAEIAYASAPQSGVKQTNFPVPGIPGAKGFEDSGSGSTGHNVAFAVGSYYYLVGTGYPAGTTSPPSGAQTVAAAKRLYERVK